MPAQKVNDTHSLHATPNNQLWLLKVQVQVTVIASAPRINPPEGTFYGAFDKRIFGKDWLKEFSDYVFIDTADGENENCVALIFFPSLTPEQRDTPYRTMTSFGDHRWPPILEALAFFKDNTFPRFTSGGSGGKNAIITGPNYFVREIYQCEVNEGSRFIQQEFIADIPYQIPSYPVPIPRAVYYDIPGARGGFPECLGPEIRIPRTQTANASFVAGNQSAASGAVRGQIYPATDMEEWEPYFLTDQQDFKSGYYRRRIMVIPPNVDDDDIIR